MIKEPTEEQAKILSHEGNIVVTARPGSGKTYTVVEKIRIVLEKLPDYKGIVAISFTNKQVIAKLAVLVRNLEPKQGRIREEHDLWNEKWIIAHVRRTLISYGLYESGKS